MYHNGQVKHIPVKPEVEVDPTGAGDIFAAQRQPRRAEEAYSKVLKHEPRMFDARLNRSMMRIYLRDFAAAREDLQTLEKMHRAITKDHPGFHFAQGILLMQRGVYKQARKAFEHRARKAFPTLLR